jgi:aryl-alcohol dehydrogenase-like predicted oxidoreductase
MIYRPLGALPVTVSVIGLGTAQLSNTGGRFQGVKHVHPEAARGILASAVDAGVTLFDTGDQYGETEELLGELPPAVKARLVIATKAGRTESGGHDFSPEYLERQVDRSLRRLGVDRLDLFQLNKPSAPDVTGDRVPALLERLKRAGKIRYAGIVVGDLAAAAALLDARSVDCVQVLYNLLFDEAVPLVERAAALGAGVIVRSPLNSGVLSGTYTASTTFTAGDERNHYFAGCEFARRLDALGSIQRDLGLPSDRLLEGALAYVTSTPGVSAAIPGASTIDQLRRYVACGSREPWPLADVTRARSIAASHMQPLRQVFQA